MLFITLLHSVFLILCFYVLPLVLNNEKYQVKFSYKDNYRREGIRVVNARPKVIIFCKSRWDLVTLQ